MSTYNKYEKFNNLNGYSSLAIVIILLFSNKLHKNIRFFFSSNTNYKGAGQPKYPGSRISVIVICHCIIVRLVIYKFYSLEKSCAIPSRS